MKEFVSAKIHNISVSDKSVEYHGSVTICRNLLKESGIDDYEKVDIVNLNNGNRWSTYAVPGNSGVFRLNGGGARLGEVGDRCVVISYKQSTVFEGAKVIFCNEANQVEERIAY